MANSKKIAKPGKKTDSAKKPQHKAGKPAEKGKKQILLKKPVAKKIVPKKKIVSVPKKAVSKAAPAPKKAKIVKKVVAKKPVVKKAPVKKPAPKATPKKAVASKSVKPAAKAPAKKAAAKNVKPVSKKVQPKAKVVKSVKKPVAKKVEPKKKIVSVPKKAVSKPAPAPKKDLKHAAKVEPKTKKAPKKAVVEEKKAKPLSVKAEKIEKKAEKEEPKQAKKAEKIVKPSKPTHAKEERVYEKVKKERKSSRDQDIENDIEEIEPEFSEDDLEAEIKPKKRRSKEKEDDKAALRTSSLSKNDTMKVYMQDIGQISLVSKEEEVDLAAKIHGTDQQEHDDARATLIQANLRLVVKIAHDFKGLGLPLLDLISEGNIGLMRAVEKFDPAKGAKFSSYAAWWIKQSMRRALANQSRTIRIPVQSAGKINKIKSVRMKLTEELGREPTDAEIAGHLDFSERTVAGLRLADLRTFSLHDPIQQGEDGEFQDIIPDRGAMTPDRILGDVESVDRLMDLLLDLDNRERMILKMRFGLDGSRPRTLEEVSQQIGRTRERVRQIQNQALSKLRTMLADEAGFASE